MDAALTATVAAGVAILVQPGNISVLDVLWIVTSDYLSIILAGDWSGYFRTVTYVSTSGATPFTIAVYFAFLNIGMALFNLIPFPIADGGWAVRYSVEKTLGEEPYWLVGALWGFTTAWFVGVHVSAVYWVFG